MKNLSFWLLLAIILISACRHQPDLPEPAPVFTHCAEDSLPWITTPDDSCREYAFPSPGPLGEYHTQIVPGALYYSVTPNPENPNEIAYISENYDALPVQLDLGVKDICTGEERILYSQSGSGFDWGPGGWIVFTDIYGKLWKIRHQGDSLTILAGDGGNYHPSWDKVHDRILYHRVDPRDYQDPNAPTLPYLRMIDSKGSILFDIPRGVPYTHPKVSPNGAKALAGGADSVFLIDLVAMTWKPVYNYAHDFCWYPDGDHILVSKVVLSRLDGLYRVRVSDGTETQLTHNCYNRVYSMPAVSSDGKKLYASLSKNAYSAPPSTMTYWRSPIVIDVLSGEEKQVLMSR